MRTRCAVRFQDAAMDVVADSEWKDYLNTRYRRALGSSPDWPWKRVHKTNLTISANARSATLPTGSWRVESVVDFTNFTPLRPLDGTTAPALIDPAEDASGAPTWYRVYGNAIEVWPKPDTNITLHVDILINAVDLSADGDFPVFPPEYHDLLVEGALADAYLDDGQPQSAQPHEASYMAILKDMQTDLLGPDQESYPVPTDTWYQ